MDGREGAESLKAKMAEAEYERHAFLKDTGVAQAYIRSSGRDNVANVMTCLFVVWMGIEVDANSEVRLTNAHVIFQLVFWFFTAFFMFDLTVHFLAFRQKKNAVKDTFFVTFSLLTIALLLYGIISCTISERNTWVSILWYAQLLRLLVMCGWSIPELAIIGKGLVVASRSMFLVLCLFAMFLYMFAIIFTKEASGTELAEHYFETVPHAMHTLFLHGALLSHYADFANDLHHNEQKGLEALLFIFTLLSLTLFALMFGVVCEVVSIVAASEKDKLVAAYMKSHILSEIGQVGAGDDATLSRKEFEDLLQRPSTCQLLKALSVDVFALVDSLDFVFPNQNAVSVSKVVEAIMQASTAGSVTKKDLVDLKRMLASKPSDVSRVQENEVQASPRDAITSNKIQKVVQESLTVSMQALQAAMKKESTVDFTNIDVSGLTRAIERMSLPGQL